MPNTAGAPAKSRLETIRATTLETLHCMTADELENPAVVESKILFDCGIAIDAQNAILPKGGKWRPLTELMPSQLADILAYSYPIVRIAGANESIDEEQDMLAMYCYAGPNAGTYVSSGISFRELARRYNYGLTSRSFDEMMLCLQELVPRRTVCQDRNLIAVNNGIFDYDTKTLSPFSPDYIFLTKSKVDYNPNAANVVIHNDGDGTDWDVESWMSELSDDPEVVHVLWQILGAIVRPLVPWNKSAWFYSESGNNGKGTLCELMRQLCGEGAYASIPLSDMGKDFMLEPLTRASAIIVDENDVGTFIDKAANLKAIVTGDVIFINRKFKTPVAYRFRGFMVQCLNEMPRIRDKSDSFFRRQLFVPFTKCFTGKERKYIKVDYLHRKEVLEYVLYKVLNMDYYQLDTPTACQEALEEYKEFVDPLRAFLMDIMPRVKWDLLPWSFLYDLYTNWYKANYGDRNHISRTSFNKDLKQLLPVLFPGWECTGESTMRPGTRMADLEPLIEEYDLKKWMNPANHGPGDDFKHCHPVHLASMYRGFYRVQRQTGSDEDVLAAQGLGVLTDDTGDKS